MSEEKRKIELAKIELEHEKLQLAREKLKAERSKAIWTNLSIFIPLLIAALTVAYNSWSQVQQSRSDFILQTAEIVLNASSPSAAFSKATFFAVLFEDQLPEDFELNAKKIAARYSKDFLEKRINEMPDQKQEILDAWLLLHPEDEWVNNLR